MIPQSRHLSKLGVFTGESSLVYYHVRVRQAGAALRSVLRRPLGAPGPLGSGRSQERRHGLSQAVLDDWRSQCLPCVASRADLEPRERRWRIAQDGHAPAADDALEESGRAMRGTEAMNGMGPCGVQRAPEGPCPSQGAGNIGCWLCSPYRILGICRELCRARLIPPEAPPSAGRTPIVIPGPGGWASSVPPTLASRSLASSVRRRRRASPGHQSRGPRPSAGPRTGAGMVPGWLSISDG